MKIITGHTGEKHIYAIDDAAINKLLVGNGDYVLPYGGQLALSEIDVHEVSVSDGYLITQGRLGVVRPGETEVFDLTDGVPGYWMAYLLVAEYGIDGEGIESMTIKAIAGARYADESSVVDPDIQRGNIDNGEPHQMPLWRIIMDGRSISRIERVTNVLSVSPLDEIYDTINQMETRITTALTDMQTQADETLATVAETADEIKNGWGPFYYQRGSTIDITTTTPCSGLTTSSSRTLWFSIPTKPIINAASININSLSVSVRLPTGGVAYIKSGSTWTLLDNGTPIIQNGSIKMPGIKSVTPTLIDGGIRIAISTSEAIYRQDKKTQAPNNIPVNVAILGNFSIQ